MRPLGIDVEGSLQDVGAWWRRERSPVLLLLAVQLVAFSYLYFLPILTNHTFPNVWLFAYPSYKTRAEGRWMSDLIFWAQGGSGVQAVQMILGTLLQACNGLLLADLVGEQRRPQRLLLATLLCLYPAFIDFYAFAGEHLTFVLGNSFALLAALALVRGDPSRARLVLASLGIALSLACYQPNLGLVALLAASVALLRVTRAAPGEAPPRPGGVLRELGAAVLVVAGGAAIYWASLRLTVNDWSPGRTNVNTLAAAWQQAGAAYVETARLFHGGIAGLSRLGHLTAIAILVLGIGGFAWDAGRRALWLVPVVLAGVATIPVALRATYVVNDQAWQNAGRILFPYGYCLLFFMARGLKARLVGLAVGVAGAGLLWSFLVFDTQQANYAAYKSQRDLWWIGRIADRVEPLTSAEAGVAVPLVVAGYYPALPVDQFIHRPGKGIQLNTPAFESYRQVEILNHFLGRDAFRAPTAAELTLAKASMTGRRPWPAAECVYLVDQTVVVLLEAPTPRTEMTWTKG